MDIELKKKMVLDYIQEHPTAYIGEISENTSIPKSSVQRYLEKCKDSIILKTGLTVKEQMKINKQRGQRKGGITSFENNDSLKDSQGRFIGSMKTTTEDKELKKQKDIYIIGLYYLSKPQISLQELANELSEIGAYTKDYVYDCLTDQRLSGLIGEEKASIIEERLKESRPTFVETTPKLR